MAMELALLEDISLELQLCQKGFIGVFGVVVGDDPLCDLGVFAKDDGVGDRGVAPTDPLLVFLLGILGFMDEDIGAFEEVDDASVRFDQGVIGL